MIRKAVLTTLAVTLLWGCSDGPDSSATPPMLVDTDMDGVPNRDDNCVYDPNLDQADADGDGIGDVCEPFDMNGMWEHAPRLADDSRWIIQILMRDGEFFARSVLWSPDGPSLMSGNAYGTYTVTGRQVEATVVHSSGRWAEVDGFSGVAEEEREREDRDRVNEFVYLKDGEAVIDGRFIQRRDDKNNVTVPLSSLAGHWDGSDTHEIFPLTVYEDSTFFGQDAEGCARSGSFSEVRPDRTLLIAQLEAANCSADMNGTFDGLAYYARRERNTREGPVLTDEWTFIGKREDGSLLGWHALRRNP